MPRLPDATCFWHVKVVPARLRQSFVMLCSCPYPPFTRRVAGSASQLNITLSKLARAGDLWWTGRKDLEQAAGASRSDRIAVSLLWDASCLGHVRRRQDDAGDAAKCRAGRHLQAG